jgi:hypothetical protein
MSRIPIAITAGVAAIAAAALIATAGSAQGPATSLHLVAKTQSTVGFFPTHRPHPGDRLGFGDR